MADNATISEMTDEELQNEINAAKIIIKDLDYKQMKRFRGDLDDEEWQETLAIIHERVEIINNCEQELEARSAANQE